jgi:hypothetical protein
MLPTYRPGDLLLGWRWFSLGSGKVVVAQADRPIIKRVAKITRDGVHLAGDNAVISSNSVVSLEAIEAVIIARIARGR